MPSPASDLAGSAAPGQPAPASRTLAEVVSDPAYADLVRQAEAAFAAAEKAGTLGESFLQFSRGVDLVRRINAREIVRSEARGAWTCGLCGFRGFWSGGPHCLGGVYAR